MKNLFKNTLFIFLILGALSGCQSVKDGLTGQKQTNSDEFLVKKKNPLSLPPDFENLPEPTTSNKNDDQNDKTQEHLYYNMDFFVLVFIYSCFFFVNF